MPALYFTNVCGMISKSQRFIHYFVVLIVGMNKLLLSTYRIDHGFEINNRDKIESILSKNPWSILFRPCRTDR